MKITSPFLHDLGGLLVSCAVRNWMSTLEYKCSFYDPTVDPVNHRFDGQKIFVLWHEYLLFPLYLRGNNNYTLLLSQHRDAEILTRTAYHMGFECVRGSTYRGGAAALRELMENSRGRNLAITPDGPRGPRRKLAQGPIYLASKLGLPIVAAGIGYDRPWRMKSWDRFALPRPYSRARTVLSPAIQLPSDLDRAGIEHYRQHVETLLNRLTLEAEAWAESGTRKLNETEVRREPSPHRHQYVHPPHLLRGPMPPVSKRPTLPAPSPRKAA
ncbi:MAG: lysophospholipid acyltransferase family protein [Pirellulales bacterium]